MNTAKFIIEDWAGNVLFNGREFDTFEDAWELIRETFPDEDDWQEYEVIPKTGEVKPANFLDPTDPVALRHR